MEYCSGGSVADLMTICQVQLTEEHIAHICAFVLWGFQYLHGSRHIHRVCEDVASVFPRFVKSRCDWFFGNGVASQDVKAGNILLTCDGRAKLGTSPFIALFPEYCWGPRPLLRNPLRLLCNCPQRILVCALN
jgi:serine/threonine protein kinase